MSSKPDSNALISRMVEKLAAEYSPQQVILFGSRATGTAHRDSDIDLLIIKDTSDRLIDRLVAVRRILSDPNRTVQLDALVLTPQEISDRLAVGDQFTQDILDRGQVLYAA